MYSCIFAFIINNDYPHVDQFYAQCSKVSGFRGYKPRNPAQIRYSHLLEYIADNHLIIHTAIKNNKKNKYENVSHN
jgi:hypothetical protein